MAINKNDIREEINETKKLKNYVQVKNNLKL